MNKVIFVSLASSSVSHFSEATEMSDRNTRKKSKIPILVEIPPKKKAQKEVEKKVARKVEKPAVKNVGKTTVKEVEENEVKNVEKLEGDVASLTLAPNDENNQPVPNNNRNAVFKTFLDMSQNLPCVELHELKTLKGEMGCESSNNAFVLYLKSFFGSDVKRSIKKCLDNIMHKNVQKQLSWSGLRTKKPSFETEYKPIVTAMHSALQGHFADYNYSMLEDKIQTLLQGAK